MTLPKIIFFYYLTSQFSFRIKIRPTYLNQNKKIANFAFAWQLLTNTYSMACCQTGLWTKGKRLAREQDKMTSWQIREEDEKARRPTGLGEDEKASRQTDSGRGWKGKLADRFGKIGKKHAERLVREEDEKSRKQTGSGRGWKGKPGQTPDQFGKRKGKETDRFERGWKGKETDRFGKRIKRQGDRQVWEEDKKAGRQTGLGRGWKGKLTDRFWKGKETDRLVNSLKKHNERLGYRMERQTDGQIERQT